MIRSVGNSLALMLALVLIGTIAGQSVGQGQSGFVDDASHVPPSPSGAPSWGSSRGKSFAVGTPAATLANPAVSASAPQSSGVQSHLRSTLVPGHNSQPVAPSRNAGSKVGPFGVGRRPDHTNTPITNNTSANNPARRVTQLGQVPATGTVKPASYLDEVDSVFPPPAPPSSEMPAVPNPLFLRSGPPVVPPGAPYPTERLRPPTIMGSHLGLQPGETATERSLRLMTAIGDLERQVDGLTQRNAELNQHVKQRDDQLLLAIREIKTARKDVSAARDELDHLRQQVKALQDKVRDAERDNAALLQTMAPLLQKLLESEEGAPPSPDKE